MAESNQLLKRCSKLVHIIRSRAIAIWLLLFCFSGFLGVGVLHAQSEKIGISLFSIQAPPDLQYLQKGIQNLLVSRIGMPGRLEAIALQGPSKISSPGSSLSLDEAKNLQKSLGVNFFLAGTITAIGQSVNIDAWLYDLKSGGSPKQFSAQGKNLNQVMPGVDLMAKDISHSLGIIPASPSANSSKTTSKDGTVESQSKVMEVLASPLLENQSISYLNPNFIEITPEESLQNIGVWRSQPLSDGIVGMDVGDVDGDKHNEIVTVSYKKLSVYKRSGAGMRVVAAYEAPLMFRFIWCSLIDLNGDGKAEIVVSAMKKKNITQGGYTGNMDKVESEFSTPSSMVFTMSGNNLQIIAKDIPFFLNTLTLPSGDKILMGQREGADQGFAPQIYDMRLQGQKLEPAQQLSLPAKCNVFNFAEVDADKDGRTEYAIILPDNRLILTRSDGAVLWKGRHRFGATTNYILGKAEDMRYNQRDYYYIPTPVLVTDLNKDGLMELVANRTPEYSRLLPVGFKYYEAGQVVSLSWDQIGLIENWSTRELSGMITSIRIADSDDNGVPELLVSVVLGKDLLQIWKTESIIFAYDLNVDKKKAQRQEK